MSQAELMRCVMIKHASFAPMVPASYPHIPIPTYQCDQICAIFWTLGIFKAFGAN